MAARRETTVEGETKPRSVKSWNGNEKKRERGTDEEGEGPGREDHEGFRLRPSGENVQKRLMRWGVHFVSVDGIYFHTFPTARILLIKLLSEEMCCQTCS